MTTNAPSNLEEVSSLISIAQKSPLERAVAGAVLVVSILLSGQPAVASETTAQLEAARKACINETRERSASLMRRVESIRALATEMNNAGQTEKAQIELAKVAKLEGKFQELVTACVELKELDTRIEVAKAENQKAEEERLAAEARAEESHKIRLTAEAELRQAEGRRLAAEARAEESHKIRLAAEAELRQAEERRLAAEARAEESHKIRLAAEAREKEVEAEGVSISQAGKLVTEIDNELTKYFKVLEVMAQNTVPTPSQTASICEFKRFFTSAVPKLVSARSIIKHPRLSSSLLELENKLRLLSTRFSMECA